MSDTVSENQGSRACGLAGSHARTKKSAQCTRHICGRTRLKSYVIVVNRRQHAMQSERHEPLSTRLC